MPTTLSRSLLTILIPGLVAISPWVLFLVQNTTATLGFGTYSTLAHALLFASVVVVGSICEGFGTILESHWDTKLNDKKELDIYGDWYAYLESTENPVAHIYLSRLVTSMYFELSMMFATPIFAIGSGFLAAFRFQEHKYPIGVFTILLMGLLLVYFYCQAKKTHFALCTTRAKIRKKIYY